MVDAIMPAASKPWEKVWQGGMVPPEVLPAIDAPAVVAPVAALPKPWEKQYTALSEPQKPWEKQWAKATDQTVDEKPAVDEGPGYVDQGINIAKGMGERVVDLFGGFGDLLAATAPSPESGIKYPYGSGNVQADLQKASQEMHDTSLGYKPGTTWEDVKSSPVGNFIPFAIEQGLVSAPDMAAAMTALPAYIAARTGELADERAINNNMQNATVDDLLAAMPAATASALLDRLGGRAMFGLDEAAIQSIKQVPKEAAKATIKEGVTEGLQEGIESTATTLGTEKGFDPMQTGEQMLAGTVGGAPVGGMVRTVSATTQALTTPPIPEGFKVVESPQKTSRLPEEGYEGATVETVDTPIDQAPVTRGGSEDGVSPPISSLPSVTPEARAILRKSAMTDDDIDAMSAEEIAQKVQEARDAGIRPTLAMVKQAERYASPVTTPVKPQATVESVPAIPALDSAQPAEASLGLPQDANIPIPEDRPVELAPQVQSELARTVDQSVQEDREADVEQAVSPEVRQSLADATRGSLAGDALAPVLPALAQATEQSLAEDMRGQGTRQSPVVVTSPRHVEIADQRVNTDASEAQRIAGNYQKSHLKLHGIDISIESPKGSIRRGKRPDGSEWEVEMPASYGYVKKSEARDGDQVDVYVGPNTASKRVYVIDQKNITTGRYDEAKAVMGVNSVSEARDLYARGFSDGFGADRIGGIKPMSTSEFKKWLASNETKRPVAMNRPSVKLNEDGFPVDQKNRVKKPDSLIEFLARKGGVREETGELATIGFGDRKTGFVAGAGPLVRKNGLHPDKAREAAEEAGYLPDNSTISDLYDALDQDTRNSRTVFSKYDDDWSMAWRDTQGGEARQAEQDAAEASPDDYAPSVPTGKEEIRRQTYARLVEEDFAGTFGDDFSQRVARYAMAGETFEDAVVYAYDEKRKEALANVPGMPEIPFFGDETNEAFAGKTDAGSQSAPSGDTEGDDARGKGIVDGTRTDGEVRGTGQPEGTDSGSRETGGSSDIESTPERASLTPPAKVYHGTSSGGFDSFDTYGGEYGLFGNGGYFTEDPSIALEYTRKGKGTNPTVYQTSIDVKNALDMDAIADKAKWEQAFGDELDEQDIRLSETNQDFYRAVEEFLSGEMLPKWEGAETMQDGIRAMGYDAITHIGGGRHKLSKGTKHRVWIVFEPEQVSKLEKATIAQPEPAVERGADNLPQSIIPGAERASDATMAQRKADAPLKPKVAQKDAGGLFSDDALQADLLDFVVTPDQARATETVVDLPSDPLFAEAVSNTPGAKVTDDGLLIDLVRYQKPEQAGATSVRTGVFYLPTGAATAKHYKSGKNGYGGRVEVRGETLLRRPLFVKGATGGKAPEAAYDQIKGKGAYQEMRNGALKVAMARADRREEVGYNFLEEYGADGNLIYEILPASTQGNTLSYALQENVVAHALREAGYDSSVGYSKANGKTVIAEVFDVREIDYPTPGETAALHPDFEKRRYADAPEGWGFAEPGATKPSLTESDQKRLAQIVAKVANLDPTFVDQIKVPKGAPGLLAWGKNEEGSTAAGFYANVRDAIVLALDSATDKAAYHEAFHRLQNLFLNEGERRVLMAELPRLREMIAQRGTYSPQTVAAMSRKEVEAEAFGLWSSAMDKDEAGPFRLHIALRRAWGRIREMSRRVKNYLGGKGFKTSEDVFRSARSGKTAKRGQMAGKIAGPVGSELQPAWHGTPHKFDKFSTEHIGSGEGAQAFGWGLYFAGKKGVAEYYRDKLSSDLSYTKDGQNVSRGNFMGDVAEAAKAAQKMHPDQAWSIARMIVDDIDDGITVAKIRKTTEAPQGFEAGWEAALNAAAEYKFDKAGKLYKVDVPEDSELLDWDKPLSEQSESVKKALGEDAYEDSPLFDGKTINDFEGGSALRLPRAKIAVAIKEGLSLDAAIDRMMEAYSEASQEIKDRVSAFAERLKSAKFTIENIPSHITGASFYSRITQRAANGKLAGETQEDTIKSLAERASRYLARKGIPGHRFLDQGSRDAGDGTHNYVIYDDSRVSILDQYAINPAVTESPAFKRWFGKSKVADADGKPLVVYHGTDSTDFSSFSTPAYFSASSGEASAYTFAGDLRKREKASGKYTSGSGREFVGKKLPYVGTLSDIDDSHPVWATDNGIFRPLGKNRFQMLTDVAVDSSGFETRDDGEMFIGVKASDETEAFNELVSEYEGAVNEAYPGGERGRVYPVYLSIKNPKEMSYLEGNRFAKRIEDDPEKIKQQVDELKAQGYDGIVTKSDDAYYMLSNEERPVHYVAFDQSQIKSATGNRGTFDPSDDRIDYSIVERAEPERIPEIRLGGRIKGQLSKSLAVKVKKGKLGSKYDQRNADDGELSSDLARRKIVDYLDPVRIMQDRSGVTMNDLINPYQTARLAEGTMRHQIQQIDDKYVGPMGDELQAVGASLEDLHRYMYAMHVPERNRVVGLRNEEGSQLYKAATDPSIVGASGKSVDQARADIAEMMQDREKFNGIRRAASHIRAMLDEGLKGQMANGLINKAQYEQLSSQYKNYVPLRAEADSEGPGGASMPSKSRGFDVRGDEFKAATGRYSEADNVVVYAVNNAEQSVLRAEKNKVGVAALRFINEADPKGENGIAEVYWSDDPKSLNDITKAPDVYKRVIGSDGKVTSRKVNTFVMKDDVVAAKIGGKTYYIKFADQKVGLALKKMTKAELNVALKILRSFSNWFSLINTRLNPEFILTNLARDIQTATVLSMGRGFSKREALKIGGNVIPAGFALFRQARGKKPKTKWDGLVKEFEAAGGRISFDQYNTVEETAKKLVGKLNGSERWKPRKAFDAFVELIGALNNSIENATRLSAFNAAREQGRTPAQSAFLARDLTVDFQKSGEWNSAIGSLYAFFNAAVQGNYNMARSLYRSKKVRGAMAGFMAAGMAQHFFNLWAAGDDDDGENAYQKLLRQQPWVFERNIVIFTGGTSYIKIPLGFGMNAFWHLGMQGGAMATGDKGFLDGVLDITRVAVDAFNPLGSSSWVTMLAPTIADPFLEIEGNKNFAGKPIYPQANAFDPAPPPESHQSFKSTARPFKTIAETMNSVFGGTDKIPSRFADVHPDTLEYLWDFLSGGIGRLAKNTFETGQRAVEGEFEPKKTPFIKTFYGDTDDQSKKSEYYNQREAVQNSAAIFDKLVESGDESSDAFYDEHSAEIEASSVFKSAEKQRKRINKDRRAIEKENPPDKAAQLEELDKEELDIMNETRKEFYEIRKNLQKSEAN